MKTQVRQHQWIMHILCPVETLEDDEGDPVIILDPDKKQAAEQNAVYGCMACSVPMVDGFGTDCPGYDEEG